MTKTILVSLLLSLQVGLAFGAEDLLPTVDQSQLSILNPVQKEMSIESKTSPALLPTAQVTDPKSTRFSEEAWISEIETSRAGRGSYFDWGLGQDGYGHCYEWTYQRQVLNNGAAQPNFLCEARRPSKHDWGVGQDGFGYCYQYTPYGVVMNQGMPKETYLCEINSPSIYRWGLGQDGYTHCYRFTPYGTVMNRGMPVSNYFCQ